MKYIVRLANGGFDLCAYESYLDAAEKSLSGRVEGPGLLNVDRFVPSGPGSFHDSRFVAASVSHAIDSAETKLEITLRGPYFDRRFILSYVGVSLYRMALPGVEDDLLMHEVHAEGDVVFHALVFASGAVIEVQCRRIIFSEFLGAMLRSPIV